MKFTIFTIFLLIITTTSANSTTLDAKLKLIADVYSLQPKQCLSSKVNKDDLRFIVGKLLFESTSLSGDRDISCSNCHLNEFGTADGLPMAIGVGGKGEGVERAYNKAGALVQRNALSLHSRGDSDFNVFFWDGKVHNINDTLYSQFGDTINKKFNDALALSSILPLIERDEFLGKTKLFTGNDIQHEVGDKIYVDRYYAVSKALKNRLINPETKEDIKLANGLQKIEIPLNNIELSHIGNLLSFFIRNNFICETSVWDKYLSGDTSSLSKNQKEGSILFYGKGRCASCHSGKLFSDFNFYSIGTPQGLLGPHTRHRDIGRAGVTHKYTDLYKFRTPPLISVKNTAPYGHNGIFKDLKSVITHHFNPLAFYLDSPEIYKSDYYSISKFIDSRDSTLKTIEIKSEQEIEQLVDFLHAL